MTALVGSHEQSAVVRLVSDERYLANLEAGCLVHWDVGDLLSRECEWGSGGSHDSSARREASDCLLVALS